MCFSIIAVFPIISIVAAFAYIFNIAALHYCVLYATIYKAGNFLIYLRKEPSLKCKHLSDSDQHFSPVSYRNQFIFKDHKTNPTIWQFN